LTAPVDAKIVTWEPRLTNLLGPGLWATTLPAGSELSRWTSTPASPAFWRVASADWSSRPTTFGTWTRLEPLEITRLTGCCVESCVPDAGSVPTARPRGTESEKRRVTLTWKPAFCRRLVASAWVRPLTGGTDTTAGPELTLRVTFVPSSVLPPPRSVG